MTRPVPTLPLVVLLLTCAPRPAAALPAFPGAEGFGAATPGGRGGAVVEVTSLADMGPGTLRAALEDATGPRTVVFRTSGTIALSRHIRMQGESDSFVTVAGQTAPGDGIQLMNYGIQISAGAHDIVLRYLRIRPSSGPGDYKQDIDAVELWGSDGSHVHDIVIDHCSLEWAMDENMSAWAQVTDVTVQRTIIAEAQVDGQDHDYAKGVLIGAESSDAKPDRFSFHHVLFAHNPDRNPRIAYATTDFRNNVVFDWGGNNSTLLGPYGGFPAGPKPTEVNLVNDIWKKGPSTYATYDDVAWLNPNTQVFALGNYGPLCPSGCGDEWQLGFLSEMGSHGPADPSIYRAPAPFAVPPVTTYATSDLTTIVLANVGASLPARDEVDARIVADVLAGTGAIGQGSGYPTLDATAPPADTDHDGIPDDWELAHGLSPADPGDRNDDSDGNGYTNLEEYLNEIGPTEFGCGDGTAYPGEACDDGNTVDGDGCDSNCTPTSCGNGITTGGETCDDGNTTGGDCCSASCQVEAMGASCDDGELCTIADACDGAGSCVGAEAPATGCREAAKGSLVLDGKSRKLVWKWLNGAPTTSADLGNPLGGGTSYALCAYDTAASVSHLVLSARMPPGAGAWKALGGPGGFGYRSKSAAPDGLTVATLKAGAAGKARLIVKGKGAALAVPMLPLTQNPTLTVQLKSSAGSCWSQSYAAPARRNDTRQFKDAFP